MTAGLATSEIPGATDGRHARGTWTPRVVPGSGGRRYVGDEDRQRCPVGVLPRLADVRRQERHIDGAPIDGVATEAATVAVTAVTVVVCPPAHLPTAHLPTVQLPPAQPPRVDRAPIRHAAVPGTPARESLAVWGPPRPAHG